MPAETVEMHETGDMYLYFWCFLCARWCGKTVDKNVPKGKRCVANAILTRLLDLSFCKVGWHTTKEWKTLVEKTKKIDKKFCFFQFSTFCSFW